MEWRLIQSVIYQYSRENKDHKLFILEQAQNLCIDASVDQILKELKSLKSYKIFKYEMLKNTIKSLKIH